MMAADQATNLWAAVTQILQIEAGEWDLSGPATIEAQTMLGADLGIDSLSLLRVLSAVQEVLGRNDLPFERLLVRDGAYVEDLTVAELVGFLVEYGG